MQPLSPGGMPSRGLVREPDCEPFYHRTWAPPANASASSDPKATAKRFASFTVPPPRHSQSESLGSIVSPSLAQMAVFYPPSGGCAVSMWGMPKERQDARRPYSGRRRTKPARSGDSNGGG
jgi:hypothetical protein